jgi:hypothetical protein
MFIPRHPVIENQFCSYSAQTDVSTGIGGVIAYSGSVVYLDPNAAGEESVVKKMVHGVTEPPFGFLMQKVKTGYHQVHPSGYVLPGDLGSSDAIAQPSYNASGAIVGTKAVPVGVAHLGIWDTVHFTCKKTVENGMSTIANGFHMKPGMSLYPAADQAKVTNTDTNSAGNTDDADQGKRCATTVVARVVKGASSAKCAANIDNTTLYPIRIKLLV